MSFHSSRTKVPNAQDIADALRAGAHVADARFDALMPRFARDASALHWTPIPVCELAAKWLTAGRRPRVLDVGSGAGKFCVVGALSRPRGLFVGVEQRPRFVDAARDLAKTFGARRCRFLAADALTLNWRAFNGIYLFNPFNELLFDPHDRSEDAPRGTAEDCERFVRGTERKLAEMPRGTRVVTFHGFGGALPAGYEKVRSERFGTAFLELWIKGAKVHQSLQPPWPLAK